MNGVLLSADETRELGQRLIARADTGSFALESDEPKAPTKETVMREWKFEDAYNDPCRVWALMECLQIGMQDSTGDMRLSKELAAELRDRLTAWLDTGSLEIEKDKSKLEDGAHYYAVTDDGRTTIVRWDKEVDGFYIIGSDMDYHSLAALGWTIGEKVEFQIVKLHGS